MFKVASEIHFRKISPLNDVEIYAGVLALESEILEPPIRTELSTHQVVRGSLVVNVFQVFRLFYILIFKTKKIQKKLRLLWQYIKRRNQKRTNVVTNYEQLKEGTMNASIVNNSCYLIKINRTYGNPNIRSMAETNLFFLP